MFITILSFLFTVLLQPTDSLQVESPPKNFDIVALQPGSLIKQDQEHFISTSLPIFKFSQIENVLRYTLKIADVTSLEDSVKAEYKNSEKLLSTLPQEVIVLDTTFFGFVFDYPQRGVKLLQPGKKYWYQLNTIYTDENEKETHYYSQIYTFTITGTYEIPNMVYQDELRDLLKKIVASGKVEGLDIEDLLVLDVRKDELRKDQKELLNILKEFVDMKESGEITIVNSRRD